eukprot:6056998-Pleurochrysis_carterae.AAC.1
MRPHWLPLRNSFSWMRNVSYEMMRMALRRKWQKESGQKTACGQRGVFERCAGREGCSSGVWALALAFALARERGRARESVKEMERSSECAVGGQGTGMRRAVSANADKHLPREMKRVCPHEPASTSRRSARATGSRQEEQRRDCAAPLVRARACARLSARVRADEPARGGEAPDHLPHFALRRLAHLKANFVTSHQSSLIQVEHSSD